MGSKNKKNKAAGTRVYGAGNKPITDERFALSQKDPRFQDVPKHKNKVAIDSRFDRMFTDKHFSTSSARVDKRGKTKTDGVSSQSVLKNYYRNEDVQKKLRQESESESESGDDVESDDEANARAKLSEFESESESESSGEDAKDDYTSTDTDEDDGGYLEEETNAMQEENVPEIEKETNRLAIVNLDWSQVQAVDLYVVLSSFLPKTGQILSVSVYPSEFGLKRMEEEAVRGPVGLFDGEDVKDKKDDDSDNSDDDDSEIDNEKLRAYELSRLRYYFAVVVCDSIATADYIYKSCDGIEFERSSNKLDLRFIPDDMEFKHPARDVATEAPSNYEGIDFQTRALQLSKIDLTWDENEPHRDKKFKRKINTDQESKYVKDEEELKEFIASSDSETDEDDDNGNGGDKKRQKTDVYRALLQSGDGSDEDEDDDKVDMEVTFHKDLEGISKKILEKKNEQSETTWDAYLRKRKEKKKDRKNRSKNSSDDDDEGDGFDDEPVEEMGDFFVGETSQKKKHKKDKKSETGEEDEASRAELELLLATDEGGDGNNVKGYNMKRKKSKGKKGGKDEIDEEKIPTVDYEDPRFSSVFTRPEFALDPTDPRFKRSAVYVRQVAHKQRKGDVDKEGQDNDSVVEARAQQADVKNESKKDKHEISMLLKSVKMKTKQLELPSSSHGKKSKKGKK